MENLKQQKKAAALSYDSEALSTPKLVAKGSGDTAEAILARAKAHGIPIHEDANLTEALQVLELNQTIPEALYSVVAEILAYIYHVNETYSERNIKANVSTTFKKQE
ncbi:FhlB domain-containing protein [Bacillaceae bacterium SIJ1]|uniref:EscU/YscU/HrcU family type III secretion system export apparatus switch protein n=1 Tax=Litoribacterium kuwaitense TaxID=1398745 RepID=UPI0013EC3E68|nr:EscU/YscU/HrcU family type III secretion system export apparatus switch protein [Litoribacterium kuwaitense]NGP44141.1 FhlB domain-containing protein [Litoribacterium kuwaitense]